VTHAVTNAATHAGTPISPEHPMRRALLLVLLTACSPDDDGSKYDTADTSDSGAVDADTDAGTDTDADTDAGTDTDGDTDAGSDTDTSSDDPIVGAWVSQGTDLAPLFRNAFFDYQRVDADFSADGSYDVLVTLNDGATVTLTGTYTTDTSTEPHRISVEQTAPEAQSSAGIYAVSGDTLTYEIASESAGCTPPTPATGFGSSSCPNLAPGDLTQTYRAP
jgi:hypothetical protein